MRSFLNRIQANKYQQQQNHYNMNAPKANKALKITENIFKNQMKINNFKGASVKQQQSRSSTSSTYSDNENFIAGRYQVKKKLGEGSFGVIRAAVDIKTGKELAIKFEHKSDVKQHLLTESKVYKDVQAIGFVQIYWFGKHGDYTALVMSKLGPSLRDLYLKCNRIFTVSTVALIAMQVIDRLEKLHDGGWLHQDIKPENITIGGVNDRHLIYLIDYGTSSRYINASNGKHREKAPSGRIVGTARYSSVTNHYGYYQSRKDDMQSFGYTLIYWMLGKLPWQKINDQDFRVKWNKVGRMKKMIMNDELCRGLPAQFKCYMDYVNHLQYKERPNYTHLKNLFRTLAKAEGNKTKFIWERLQIKM